MRKLIQPRAAQGADLGDVISFLTCTVYSSSLQWRHNGCDSVSNHQRLFTQPLIQTQIKENIKAPRHLPLCGEFTAHDQ